MGAFVNAGARFEADFVEPKLLDAGLTWAKGKKRADIVNVAGERRFERIKRSAGPRLSFENAQRANRPAQRRRRHETVGPGPDHQHVIQAHSPRLALARRPAKANSSAEVTANSTAAPTPS